MINGRSRTSDQREENKFQVQQLITSFNKQFGSTQCYKLTECDLGTDEGQEKYNINECNKLCDCFVAKATQLTLDLIDQ
jgi:hypothetical protein